MSLERPPTNIIDLSSLALLISMTNALTCRRRRHSQLPQAKGASLLPEPIVLVRLVLLINSAKTVGTTKAERRRQYYK